MQDIHHHPDGGSGGGPTGSRNFNDRRSRLHHHLLHHHQAALKCPRCDSLNTKFCYYNNYNLSQPRHFCKNCRRYWTKGGVLRNVPVGGGCRKSKRSKTNKPSKKSVTNNSHSSSESTTTTTTATTITTVSGGGAVFENNRQPDPNQIAELLFTTGELGELTTLIGNSSADPTASFHQLAWDGGVHHQEEDEKLTRGMIQGALDPTVAIDDLLQNRGVNGGIPTLDCWQDSGQGLFDLPSTVDHHHQNHQSFWSQTTSSHHFHHNQWSDNSNNITNNDHTLFLP